MSDAATLEREYAEAATGLRWWNVTWNRACTSFRDVDCAKEYRDRIQIRYGVRLDIWSSEHIPGYEPADV
jgi:hypothetical protein